MTVTFPKTCESCEYCRTLTPEGFPFTNCQLKRDLGYKDSQIYDHSTKSNGNLYGRIYGIRDKDCPLVTEYEKRCSDERIREEQKN